MTNLDKDLKYFFVTGESLAEFILPCSIIQIRNSFYDLILGKLV